MSALSVAALARQAGLPSSGPLGDVYTARLALDRNVAEVALGRERRRGRGTYNLAQDRELADRRDGATGSDWR